MPDEPGQESYYVAARFSDDSQAEREYFRIQRYIGHHSSELDLSVYRFQLPGQFEGSIVAVLGDYPGEAVDKRLRRALSIGEKTILDDQILSHLQQRRTEATELGPWVERHYRPGRGLNLDR